MSGKSPTNLLACDYYRYHLWAKCIVLTEIRSIHKFQCIAHFPLNAGKHYLIVFFSYS